MLLKGPHIQLIPYTPTHWGKMAEWFYDNSYRDMWRHHPKAWGQHEFEKYPQILNAEVFLIFQQDPSEPIGFCQIIPDCKTNRGFFVGLLIDKKYQKNHLPGEVLHLLFDYSFNRLGYRKAIIEVVESNLSLNKLLQKMGFLKEGTLFGEAFIEGNFVNETRYCMLSSFFNKKFLPNMSSWR